MDFKAYLQKLQGMSDKNKKIVLWAIVAVLAIVMGSFWIKSAGNRLNEISKNIGQIKLPEIPQVETPNIETTPDQTADWQTSEKDGAGTYINDVYNYEITYLAGTKIKENLVDNPKSCVYLNYGTGQITIKSPDSTILCLRSSASAYAKEITQNIIINGNEYKAEGIIDEGRKYLQFSLYGGGAIISFETDETDAETENKIEQMISTFKFTK